MFTDSIKEAAGGREAVLPDQRDELPRRDDERHGINCAQETQNHEARKPIRFG
jgi:hypothetical protein